MDRANEAGVMRPYDMAQLDGIVEVLDLQAEKALFPMPTPAGRIARGTVPRRRCDDLVVGDLPAPNLHPVPETASRGVDKSATVRVSQRPRRDVGGLVQMAAQLRHRSPHLPQGEDRSVETAELPQPGVGTFCLEEGGNEWVLGHHQVGERAELDDLIVVAARLGVTVGFSGSEIGHRVALPGVTTTARIDEPGVADVLGNAEVRERLDLAGFTVVMPGLLEAGAALKGRCPLLRIEVAPGTEQVRHPRARAVQADGAAQPREHPEGAV